MPASHRTWMFPPIRTLTTALARGVPLVVHGSTVTGTQPSTVELPWQDSNLQLFSRAIGIASHD